jgi:hypothetical protein
VKTSEANGAVGGRLGAGDVKESLASSSSIIKKRTRGSQSVSVVFNHGQGRGVQGGLMDMGGGKTDENQRNQRN